MTTIYFQIKTSIFSTKSRLLEPEMNEHRTQGEILRKSGKNQELIDLNKKYNEFSIKHELSGNFY